MALRGQPYLPLYVQDFMTDERLIECSAESVGVYIRLMCVLHKSEEYGALTLGKRDERTGDICFDFASKLLPHLPYKIDVIHRSLCELFDQKVLQIEGEKLYQKRMVKDGLVSIARAEAGRAGGRKPKADKKQNVSKRQAKQKQNTENEYEVVSVSNNVSRTQSTDVPTTEDTELRKNQDALNAVFDAAGRSGFGTSSAEMDKLNLIVADYGAEAVLRAIDICVESKACTLRYLRGILNKDPTGGTLKKPADNGKYKTVIEQQYSQREYDPTQYNGLTPAEIEEIKKYGT